MKTITLQPPTHFAVISDVHLADPQDKTTQLFIAVIDKFVAGDTVFLLGDIFDFIAVSGSFFLRMWENVFSAFCRAKERGVALHFLEGNHDFGFEHFRSPFLDACFTTYGDHILEFENPTLGKVQLRHGDDVVCPPAYLRFRGVVKSRLFQMLTVGLCPGAVMQVLFSRYARFSRTQDAYRPLNEAALLAHLSRFEQLYPQVNALILGHLHVEKAGVVSANLRFWVGPSWAQRPTILRCSDSFPVRCDAVDF